VQLRPRRDRQREQLRPRLIADRQQVAEAPRDRQPARRPAALEQRVGRQRRAHAHATRRYHGVLGEPEQAPDRQQRRLVRRQQLHRPQRPRLRLAPDAVGEGPAAIDPDVPGPGHGAS
jgi:hypothetical protein